MGERRAQSGLGSTLKATAVAVFAFYIVGGILNGPNLHHDAGLRPYGQSREWWMKATAPLAQAAVALHMDGFRRWVEDIRSDGE